MNIAVKREDYFKIPMFKERCQKILFYYNFYPQVVQTSEEMSELNVELIKWVKGKDNKDKVINELADVYIMLNQMKIAIGISENEIGHKIDEKLTRQIERIKEEKNKIWTPNK